MTVFSVLMIAAISWFMISSGVIVYRHITKKKPFRSNPLGTMFHVLIFLSAAALYPNDTFFSPRGAELFRILVGAPSAIDTDLYLLFWIAFVMELLYLVLSIRICGRSYGSCLWYTVLFTPLLIVFGETQGLLMLISYGGLYFLDYLTLNRGE